MVQLSLLSKRAVRVRPTSIEARRSIKASDISRVQAAILGLLRIRGAPGLSDDDVLGWLQRSGLVVSPSGCRTRRSELVRAGKVVAAGTTTNARGRTVTLWRLA